jgi:hypothetical protein
MKSCFSYFLIWIVHSVIHDARDRRRFVYESWSTHKSFSHDFFFVHELHDFRLRSRVRARCISNKIRWWFHWDRIDHLVNHFSDRRNIDAFYFFFSWSSSAFSHSTQSFARRQDFSQWWWSIDFFSSCLRYKIARVQFWFFSLFFSLSYELCSSRFKLHAFFSRRLRISCAAL